MKINDMRGIPVTFEKVPQGGCFWSRAFYLKAFSIDSQIHFGVNIETGVVVEFAHDRLVTYMPHATISPYGDAQK